MNVLGLFEVDNEKKTIDVFDAKDSKFFLENAAKDYTVYIHDGNLVG